ncbi:MAG: hypothetical protein ACI9G1_002291, partial [Pirellulaceae bacterium]
ATGTPCSQVLLSDERRQSVVTLGREYRIKEYDDAAADY